MGDPDRYTNSDGFCLICGEPVHTHDVGKCADGYDENKV